MVIIHSSNSAVSYAGNRWQSLDSFWQVAAKLLDQCMVHISCDMDCIRARYVHSVCLEDGTPGK